MLESPAVSCSEMVPKLGIIDIRQNVVEMSLKDEIVKSLKPEEGLKKLPTLLLYDERGLQIFEQASSPKPSQGPVVMLLTRNQITYLEEYYLTNAEIEVLQASARKIAEAIPSGSMVVELGSGNLRKVSILLRALDDMGKHIDYYALDLSLKELYRTLEQVPAFKNVKCHGLHGTYDDGLDWLKTPENIARPKCVMSLGSSIGNFSRAAAAQFLKGFSQVLRSSDSMLIGLDATDDPSKVYHAYNDREGVTHKFILNGLANANRIYNEQVFEEKDWRVIGEYVYDQEGGRHQAFYSPVRDVFIKGVQVKAGERIHIEQSLKYSPEGAAQLWKDSGLIEVDRMSASSDAYGLYLLKRNMAFKTNPSLYAASTVPTLEDWKEIWSVWDLVTRSMIPEAQLNEKPIKLRNAYIFYLGHIPTFIDIQLSAATQQPMCESADFKKIFERGIDPDVDNPERCHDHSEIPEEWPPIDEILRYQSQVRAKIESYTTAKNIPRDVGRSLWIGFEHEILHLETLLYMLLQSDKTLPPTKFTPYFEEKAKFDDAAKVDNEWFEIPEQRINIGLNDPEDNSGGDQHFGWDNEKPTRSVLVPAFKAQARAITNEDYARYLEQTHESKIPASWAENPTNGTANGASNGHPNGQSNGHVVKSAPLTKAYLDGKSVRTVYGLVPLKFALNWPIFASYNELDGCAKWMDGRIPTFEEARSIYSHVDGLRRKEAEQHLGKTVPAVNGHLVNDGVEESPPPRDDQPSEGSMELFTNLENANVGFKHWHPVAITANGSKLAGQADMGGVWEWTSTELSKHEGFEPMKLYPAYTADFFDGKHNIVLGGSWATHPRIAGRKTFVNWYQRNYPFAWAGARLVRDL